MQRFILEITMILFFGTIFSSHGQNFTIQPYLQNAFPDKMTVMWECSYLDDARLDWGTSPSFGNSSYSTHEITNGSACLFTVKLNSLQANTKYYYQAITGNSSSSVFNFITPSDPNAEKSINIVAMSDMQKDNNNPNKFDEIVHDGIIDYIQANYGEQTNEHLDMILIPGDLVSTGTNYSQWRDDFFAPSEPLFSSVPVYPVLGNHEVNADLYFKYFDFDDNGNSGYEEHWWYKDNSNVRVIGLNSNPDYQIQEQLDWLENLLNQTASDNSIDFIFTELHHPHKSELWTPGNTSFTGDVIALLESFSSETGKPSVHFYGHTHGYSRGQSKDHTHLMVNVATAGGFIDYWGESAQQDYEEYTISQDEWGYVFMEVVAGDEPKFTLKRLSIGDDDSNKDNSLEDSITIRLNNIPPNSPQLIFPSPLDTVNPNCLVLSASAFIDSDNDQHGASQWQISSDCGNFSNPEIDQWKQYENWYFDINTQVNDDLTDEQVGGLEPLTDYCWRARYRDKSLAWSEWSEPSPFRTDISYLTDNLLENIGAEDQTNFWIIETGNLESLTAFECDGIEPFSGERYFSIGGICEEFDFGSVHQIIDVSSYQNQIDEGITQAIFGAYMSSYSGSDRTSVAIQYLDENQNLLLNSDTTYSTSAGWTFVDQQWAVPAYTRFIKYILMGELITGTDNDSYADDSFLHLNLNAVSCSFFASDNLETSLNSTDWISLKLFPNPISDIATLNIPNQDGNHLVVRISNIQGENIREFNHIHPPTFTFEKGNLKTGLYFLSIFNQNILIGKVRFLVL